MSWFRLKIGLLAFGLGILSALTFILFYKLLMAAASSLRQGFPINGGQLIALTVTGEAYPRMDYSNVTVGSMMDGACYGRVQTMDMASISDQSNQFCMRFPEPEEITPPVLNLLKHHHQLQTDFGEAIKAINTANSIISGLLWQAQILACAVFFLVVSIIMTLYFAYTLNKLCELQGDLRGWMRNIADALRALPGARGLAQQG